MGAAVKMLRKTLEWRQSYRPQDISFQEIRPLAATGRLEVLEHRDLDGRPVLCYRLRCATKEGLSRLASSGMRIEKRAKTGVASPLDAIPGLMV